MKLPKDYLVFPKGQKVLSFLPICHIFERVLIYIYQYAGTTVYFAESIEKIGDNVREVKPNLMSVVPRLLEKMSDKILAKGADLSGMKKMLYSFGQFD